MSIKIVKYDSTTTYMFPNGEVATPAVIEERFPAVKYFTHILEVNGNVCQAVQELGAMRNYYGIDTTLTDDEAITAIETVVNTPVTTSTVSAEERIAAALEFQNVLALDDATTTTIV